MIKKKAVLIDSIGQHFSIEDHCVECVEVDACDVPPTPEDYNYSYGVWVYVGRGDEEGIIIQLPAIDTPVAVGDLVTIEYVETDIDGDEVWRLCDG